MEWPSILARLLGYVSRWSAPECQDLSTVEVSTSTGSGILATSIFVIVKRRILLELTTEDKVCRPDVIKCICEVVQIVFKTKNRIQYK